MIKLTLYFANPAYLKTKDEQTDCKVNTHLFKTINLKICPSPQKKTGILPPQNRKIQ